MNLTFKLTDDFIHQYRNVDPGFGFNGLGLLHTIERIPD